MIWNVVFVNKSWKLGWIWMKLGRWGWGLKRLSLACFQRFIFVPRSTTDKSSVKIHQYFPQISWKQARFPAKSRYGFRREREKWVAEAFFCDVNDAPLLPFFLDRLPQNFPQTRVQVVARDIWFHIPEKFPLRDQICRKTLFFSVPYLCSAYGSREMFCDAYTLSIP